MPNNINWKCFNDSIKENRIWGVKGLKTFNFRGQPIRYEHTGKGSPVILLHNGGTSHAIWREIAPHLADGYELFAFDLLGYGASAKPGRGYDHESYVDFLAEFIEQNRLAPVNMIGNCMGSAMSLGLAIRRPEDVRALVLMNPLTEATFLGGILGMTLRLRRRAPGFSRAVYRLLGRIRVPAMFTSMVLGFQIGPEGKSRKVHRDAELRGCFSSRGQMRSLLGVLDDLVNYDYLDRYVPDQRFPPLCTIWGQQNRILSPQAGRILNGNLKPLRQEWLEGCGHLLMLEQPERVAAIVRQFLSRGEHREREAAARNEEVPR